MTEQQIDALVAFIIASARCAAIQSSGVSAPHAESEQRDAEDDLRASIKERSDENTELRAANAAIIDRMAQTLFERNSAREELSWERQLNTTLRHQLEVERPDARCPADPAHRGIAEETLEALQDCVAELSPLMTAHRPQHYEAIIGKANRAIARATGAAAVALALLFSAPADAARVIPWDNLGIDILEDLNARTYSYDFADSFENHRKPTYARTTQIAPLHRYLRWPDKPFDGPGILYQVHVYDGPEPSLWKLAWAPLNPPIPQPSPVLPPVTPPVAETPPETPPAQPPVVDVDPPAQPPVIAPEPPVTAIPLPASLALLLGALGGLGLIRRRRS